MEVRRCGAYGVDVVGREVGCDGVEELDWEFPECYFGIVFCLLGEMV